MQLMSLRGLASITHASSNQKRLLCRQADSRLTRRSAGPSSGVLKHPQTPAIATFISFCGCFVKHPPISGILYRDFQGCYRYFFRLLSYSLPGWGTSVCVWVNVAMETCMHSLTSGFGASLGSLARWRVKAFFLPSRRNFANERVDLLP